MVPFWTLTFATFKSRSNQKPGYCVMYMYPYYIYLFGADPAITSGVTALFLFLVLAKPQNQKSCNICWWRQRSDVAPRSCIVMMSWNSGPNSGALETAAQQWGLSPDQHFMWSDIFITQQIPWAHSAWFWKGLHVYFLQIVVFVDGSIHVG
jgi:hypothetical protein